MSHRSVPPSQANPPKVPTSVVVSAIRAARDTSEPERKAVRRHERIVRGGKVVAVPAPNGAVKIIGLSENDEWIAEFSCREEDFSELYIRRMEQHVAQKTGVRIAVLG